MRNRLRHVRGFTLVEMLASMAIMTILLGAMTSAILIAGHALPDEDDLSEKTALAVEVSESLTADLVTAITVIQAAPNIIEFTVPDRGHGTAGPETIRYSWSGVPGAPLTRRYNTGLPVTIAKSVEAFSLAYTTQAGELQAPPSVLLVTAASMGSSPRKTATLAAMQSWGFPVQSIADDATPAQFTTALLSADVVYTLPETTLSKFSDKPADISQGVVIAGTSLYTYYGMASGSGSTNTDTVSVTTTGHPVTEGLSGSIRICSSSQIVSQGTSLAPSASSLATVGILQPALFAVDWGGKLTSGAAAVGRRIAAPSGINSFDYTKLTTEGARLERNAIVWAASPKVIARATIVVQVGTSTSGRVRSDAQLLNLPEVP
jgi:prepilin-type N-terminal cleavage/methylation domain-containing protein